MITIIRVGVGVERTTMTHISEHFFVFLFSIFSFSTRESEKSEGDERMVGGG